MSMRLCPNQNMNRHGPSLANLHLIIRPFYLCSRSYFFALSKQSACDVKLDVEGRIVHSLGHRGNLHSKHSCLFTRGCSLQAELSACELHRQLHLDLHHQNNTTFLEYVTFTCSFYNVSCSSLCSIIKMTMGR